MRVNKATNLEYLSWGYDEFGTGFENRLVLAVDNSFFNSPMRTVVSPNFKTDKPVLTGANLAESIESIYAKRLAGITPPLVPLLSERTYPTDPQSIADASKMIADYKQQLEQKLEGQKQQFQNNFDERAVAARKSKKEHEEFLAFKKRQSEIAESK